MELKHAELVPKHENLTKELVSLKDSIAIDKNSGTEKEEEINALRYNVEASEKQIMELKICYQKKKCTRIKLKVN